MTEAPSIETATRLRVVYCYESSDPATAAAIFRFRKERLIDALGWKLAAVADLERDEFDTDDTVHCGLFEGARLVGCFRAIRTDRPYLARERFPELASHEPYPTRPVSWEISRLAVHGDRKAFGRSLRAYAAMFHFAIGQGAYSLVAFCDLGHERLLNRIGITTRRFGDPMVIGTDRDGRSISAVAGEIPLRAQDPERLKLLLSPLRNAEIDDATATFGRAGLSA